MYLYIFLAHYASNMIQVVKLINFVLIIEKFLKNVEQNIYCV